MADQVVPLHQLGPGRSLRAVAHNRRTCLTPAGVIAERIKRFPNVGCQRRATASGDPDQTPLPGSEAVGQIIVDIDEEVRPIVCAVAAVPVSIIRCLSKLAKRQSRFERHEGGRSVRVFTDGELGATPSERWRGRAKDAATPPVALALFSSQANQLLNQLSINQTGTDVGRNGRCRAQRVDILDRCAERQGAVALSTTTSSKKNPFPFWRERLSRPQEHQRIHCIRSQGTPGFAA